MDSFFKSRAQTSQGCQRISHGSSASVVDEEVRKRMSAPLAASKPKKRSGNKKRSLFNLKSCIRVASQPIPFVKKAKAFPSRQMPLSNKPKPLTLFKPATIEAVAKCASNAAIVHYEIVHQSGLKIVVRRVNAS